MLPDLETTMGTETPLSFMLECPSLSSSIFSSDMSAAGSQGLRRSSLGSGSTASSPGLFFTSPESCNSPVTPMMSYPRMNMAYPRSVKPVANFESCQPIFHLQDEEAYPEYVGWMGSRDCIFNHPSMNGTPDMLMPGPAQYWGDPKMQCLNNVIVNPSLTKPIFGTSTGSSVLQGDEYDLAPWPTPPTNALVETIEPRATFQAMIPSSPSYKLEPSTPLHSHAAPSSILSSSPFSTISPRVLPSQHDIEEPSYGSLEESFRLHVTRKHRLNADRLYRRGYERKRLSGASSKPKKAAGSASGINCDAVITKNEFACNYPGCIDKTGLQKRFKRQEHRKRHEKTVHEKDVHSAFKCWVPECHRPFSRTDNLKSHLRNTHSRKTGVRGNRYVATLDRNSEYYNPEWVGDLDQDGYPLDRQASLLTALEDQDGSISSDNEDI